MVVSIGMESRVPSRLSEIRIWTIPVAVLSEVPIADVVVDPPTVVREGPCRVVARRKPAIAILERCLAVVAAGAVQGDRAIVALALYRHGKCEALGAIRIQVAAGLAGKEMTGNQVDQWIIGGRAADSSYNNSLHIVVVVRAASVTGLQRVVDITVQSANSAYPAEDTVVSKLRSPRCAIGGDDVLDKNGVVRVVGLGEVILKCCAAGAVADDPAGLPMVVVAEVVDSVVNDRFSAWPGTVVEMVVPRIPLYVPHSPTCRGPETPGARLVGTEIAVLLMGVMQSSMDEKHVERARKG